jgi:hypothetical protein
MPVVLIIDGFKFRFFSNENDEPAHVHIVKAAGNAKFWLLPEIAEEYSYGYTVRERRIIRELVETNRNFLISKWNGFFGK